MKKRKGRRNIKLDALDALEMYRTYEDRYWKLMMIWTDNNQKIERQVTEMERRAEYWRKKYEKLIAVG